MKSLIIPALSIFLAFSCRAEWQYPPTKTVDAEDTYFGKTYRDPYRWLENLKDKEVVAWFKAQAQLTDGLLAKIPGRQALVDEWMSLDKLKPAAYTAIAYEHGRVFYKKTLGGENVGKLYFREGWDGAEKQLFDPGSYKSGVVTTIESVLPSWDGKYVVMGLSSGGAEYSELRVLDVDRGTLLPDSMYPSMGPLGWTKDSKSFFYDIGKVTDIKSPDIELNRETKRHTLGADVAGDIDILSNESNPELGITAKEIPDAFIEESYPNYIVGLAQTVQNEMRIFYAPISGTSGEKIKWNVLCKPSDNIVRGFEFHDQYIYAITHTGAPKYKVVRTSVKHPDWAQAETVVPEGPDSIESMTKCKH
jgi:prolyl oligopeptidase